MVRFFHLRGVLFIGVFLLSGCGTFSQSFNDVLNDSRVKKPVWDDPVARLPLKQQLVRQGQQVILDASLSHSLDDQPLRYQWYLLEKPPQSNANLRADNPRQARLLIDQPGRYRVRLVVNDGQFDSKPFDALLSTVPDDLDKVRFIALGDAGTGGDLQYKVADAISAVCAQRGCDFALGAGDNIYAKGPSSVDDEQFATKFERPYKNVHLPFFMVLGNHDNSGLFAGDGGFNARGMIEVEYTKISDKWTMPERYYRITAPLQGERFRKNSAQNNQPLVEIYALDSTPLTSAPDIVPEYRIKDYTANQARWVAAGLNNSKAQWKIAFAHHPYLSNGFHGNAGDYDRITTYTRSFAPYLPRLDKNLFQRAAGTYFKRFFEQNLCDQLDLFIAGHDHNLQWLKPIETCGKTEFIVSGAGAKFKALHNLTLNEARKQINKEAGFFWFEVIADRMTVAIYTVDKQTGAMSKAYEHHIAHVGY